MIEEFKGNDLQMVVIVEAQSNLNALVSSDSCRIALSFLLAMTIFLWTYHSCIKTKNYAGERSFLNYLFVISVIGSPTLPFGI